MEEICNKENIIALFSPLVNILLQCCFNLRETTHLLIMNNECGEIENLVPSSTHSRRYASLCLMFVA